MNKTSFAAEFNKLFKNGGGCSVKNTDWNAPRYFDSTSNDCYSAEAALVSSLTSEAYGKYGFEVQYYIKDISTKIDKLYGEDPLENVKRRFVLQMYTDQIPSLQKQYELQGMIYSEIITCQCTIQHFYEASQLSYPEMEAKYEPIVPKIGDVIYVQYSDLYYEIVNVKEFGDNSTFLSTPITYTFHLRVWRNNHDDVDLYNQNTDDMDDFRKYNELAETFNLDINEDNKPPRISDVAAASDTLSINEKIKKDTDSENIPVDNVPTHVIYKSKDEMKENPAYLDPFNGW